MKKRVYLILFLSCMLLTASAQISFVEKMGTQKGLFSATISKSALRMMKDNDQKFGAIVDKLTGLETLGMSNSSGDTKQMVAKFKRIATANKFEELMTVKGKDEKTAVIYFRDFGNDIRQFALLQESPQGFGIYILSGSVTLKDIQGIVEK